MTHNHQQPSLDTFVQLWLETFPEKAREQLMKSTSEYALGLLLSAGMKVVLGPMAVMVPEDACHHLARLLVGTTLDARRKMQHNKSGLIYTLARQPGSDILVVETPNVAQLRDFEEQFATQIGAPIKLVEYTEIPLANLYANALITPALRRSFKPITAGSVVRPLEDIYVNRWQYDPYEFVDLFKIPKAARQDPLG